MQSYDPGSVSVWRRRAIESFPELRRELNDRHEIERVYTLWIEHLFPLWVNAHTSGNDDKLDRIYGYADWCSQQRAEDRWNSAGVCFYEHVLCHGRWETVLLRLSNETIRNVWVLWEYHLSDAQMAALRKFLQEQKRPVPPPGTGLVQSGDPQPKKPTGASGRSPARRSPRRGTRPRRDQRP